METNLVLHTIFIAIMLNFLLVGIDQSRKRNCYSEITVRFLQFNIRLKTKNNIK